MKSKVVVISGATGELGKQAAKAFAARGDSLVLLSRDPAHLAALAHELDLPDNRVLTYAADLTDSQAMRLAAEVVTARFGAAQILLHLVGGWTGGKNLIETVPEDFQFMLEQHAYTTFNLFQAFIPQLIQSGWGRVVAVSAPVASRPTAKRGAYAAAKAAQEALILTLAEELKDHAITANIIVVSSIDIANTGVGATPAEIMAAILYLCSDEGSRVNGARLPLL